MSISEFDGELWIFLCRFGELVLASNEIMRRRFAELREQKRQVLLPASHLRHVGISLGRRRHPVSYSNQTIRAGAASEAGRGAGG